MTHSNDYADHVGRAALLVAGLFALAAICGPIWFLGLHQLLLWLGAVAGTLLLVATSGWLMRLFRSPEPSRDVMRDLGIIALLTAGVGAYPARFWSAECNHRGKSSGASSWHLSVLFGGGASEAVRQKSNEELLVYRNRIAKDVIAGVWEAQWDNTDLVAPDGSNSGVKTMRLHFRFEPSDVNHGFIDITESINNGPFTSIGGCNSWKLMMRKRSMFGGAAGIITTYPEECPGGPTEGPSYDLMRIRLKHAREMPRPDFEFILRDEKTLLQKNGDKVGGLGAEIPSMVQEVTWRKVQ